ncbi:hypothetical protein SAMN04489740_2545 [Arthrobacter alpinus]|uniref:Uncharacterized protein n=1 Tax=Arthrobacter alpinus TaxID=656366 RepID=A0A1H5LPD6_9MICC|nr:hypothetical protein SAMN04489740_2545 [Arthrobacter alpinus]
MTVAATGRLKNEIYPKVAEFASCQALPGPRTRKLHYRRISATTSLWTSSWAFSSLIYLYLAAPTIAAVKQHNGEIIGLPMKHLVGNTHVSCGLITLAKPGCPVAKYLASSAISAAISHTSQTAADTPTASNANLDLSSRPLGSGQRRRSRSPAALASLSLGWASW